MFNQWYCFKARSKEFSKYDLLRNYDFNDCNLYSTCCDEMFSFNFLYFKRTPFYPFYPFSSKWKLLSTTKILNGFKWWNWIVVLFFFLTKISFHRKETTLKTEISNGFLIHTQIPTYIHTEQPSQFILE